MLIFICLWSIFLYIFYFLKSDISGFSHLILYGILGVYSYYSIFFIHKNIWNMICYMHFVVYIKYYSLYILFIFIFIFLFFARANIQTIICHRSYVYIFGLEWFIYWFINSESGEDGYVYHFHYVYGSFDYIWYNRDSFFMYMNVCSFFIYIYNCSINYIIPLYSIYPHHYLFFI